MPHVLIIEDSYLFGQFVSDAAVLAGAGSVEVAEGQVAAEAAAVRKAPAIIIADVKLDDGSGLSAVQRIASSSRSVPVLYVTGYPEQCSGCPAGATVVEKPISHDDLRARITAMLAEVKQASRH